MGNEAIPPGGGLAAGLKFLSDPVALRAGAKAAQEWVREAIAVVRTAPDNPLGSDEEICGELLRRIEARRHSMRVGGK